MHLDSVWSLDKQADQGSAVCRGDVDCKFCLLAYRSPAAKRDSVSPDMLRQPHRAFVIDQLVQLHVVRFITSMGLCLAAPPTVMLTYSLRNLYVNSCSRCSADQRRSRAADRAG